MSFSFASIPHAIAAGFQEIAKGASYAEKELKKFAGGASQVEQITSLIPVYGAEGVTIERAAYTALGLVLSTVTDAGKLGSDGVAAAEKLFTNAGADQSLINDFKQLYADYKNDLPSFSAVAAAAK